MRVCLVTNCVQFEAFYLRGIMADKQAMGYLKGTVRAVSLHGATDGWQGEALGPVSEFPADSKVRGVHMAERGLTVRSCTRRHCSASLRTGAALPSWL